MSVNINKIESPFLNWFLELTKPTKKLTIFLSVTTLLSLGFNIIVTLCLAIGCLIFSKKLLERKDDDSILILSGYLRAVGVLCIKFILLSLTVMMVASSIKFSQTVPKDLMIACYLLQALLIFSFVVISFTNIYLLGANRPKPVTQFTSVITFPIKALCYWVSLALKALFNK